MIFIGSLLLICFPLGNGRSLTEKRELPLKETIVPTPGNDNSHIIPMSIGDMKRD